MYYRLALPLFATSLLCGQTIYMNFGDTAVTGQPETWNNFTDSSVNILTADLLDGSNNSTGIQLEITNEFEGTNTNGTTNASAPYPTSATSESFFSANSNWSNPGDNQAIMKFSGLDVNKTYDFTFYASRILSPADNRTTVYTLEGLNTDFAKLDPVNNVTNTVMVTGIAPTAGGEITLTLTPDTANNNTNQFTYLGVAEISIIPEPSTFALLTGFSGLAYMMLRRRRA